MVHTRIFTSVWPKERCRTHTFQSLWVTGISLSIRLFGAGAGEGRVGREESSSSSPTPSPEKGQISMLFWYRQKKNSFTSKTWNKKVRKFLPGVVFYSFFLSFRQRHLYIKGLFVGHQPLIGRKTVQNLGFFKNCR